MGIPAAQNSLLMAGQYFSTLMGESNKEAPLETRLENLGLRYAILYGRIYDIEQARFVSLAEVRVETANEQYAYKPTIKEEVLGENWKMYPLWDAYLKYHARPKYDGIVFAPAAMGSRLDHAGAFNLAHAPFECNNDLWSPEPLPQYEAFLEAYFKNNPDLIEVWHSYVHELLFRSPVKSLEWHVGCPDAMLAQSLPNIIRKVASPYCTDVHPLMSLAQRQEACLGKLVAIDTRVPNARRLVSDVFYNWAQQGVCAYNPKHGVPLLLTNFLRVFGVHLEAKSMPDVSRLRCVYEVTSVSNKLAGAKVDFEQWQSANADWGKKLYQYYKERKYAGHSIGLWFASLNS